jgi:CubicO group peptidase (beta-lactamase class C family)
MMNRSVVAKWILPTLAAASAACGSTGRGEPAAEEQATTQSRAASRVTPPPLAITSAGRSPRARAMLARKMSASPTSASAAIPARYQAFAAAFDLDARIAGAPGAAVALIEHGRVTFRHGYGTAGMNSTAPVDENTIFRVGTMTQPLTAAAELVLADRGKASLAEPLASAVPGVALGGPYAGSLTMRQLLSSQSGLFDFTSWSVDPELATNACSTDQATLQSFVAGSLFGQNELFMTPPGAIYAASSPNFILAGAAIEKQTGAFFTDALKSLLFTPLGMTRTLFVPSDVTSAGNYSDGTIYDANGNLADVTPSDYDCAAYRPFGYAFSSVSDYAKFVQLLLGENPEVLSEESRHAMEAAQAETRDLGHIAAEGYGLTVSTGYVTQANAYHRTKTLGSTGQIEGFSSLFYAFPETGFGVVVLSNLGGAQFADSVDVAVQTFAELPAPSPLPRRTFAVGAKFARYAGTYVDPTGTFGTIVVSDDGGSLSVSFPDADALGLAYWPQLSTVLDDSFLVTFFGYPNLLHFREDARGGYRYLLIDDAIAATRVSPDGGP